MLLLNQIKFISNRQSSERREIIILFRSICVMKCCCSRTGLRGLFTNYLVSSASDDALFDDMLYLSWGMKARAIINISCFDQLHVMTTYSQNARKLSLSVFCRNTIHSIIGN